MQSAHCSFSPHTVPYILQETQNTVQFGGCSVADNVKCTLNTLHCTLHSIEHHSTQYMFGAPYIKMLTTGWLILLATPNFPYVPESRKKQSPELATL